MLEDDARSQDVNGRLIHLLDRHLLQCKQPSQILILDAVNALMNRATIIGPNRHTPVSDVCF